MRFRILALLATFLLPLPLMADNISFTLTTDEHGKSTPPSGSVLVTIDLTDTTHASVTFTGENGYLVGNVFLNVNGAFTVGTISGSVASYHSAGAGGLDSYGSFSEFVTPTPSEGSTFIDINLIASGINSWASASSVLALTTGFNPSYYPHGFDAAATVGLFSGEGSGSRDNLDIAGSIAPTPEPGSLMLVGTGLLSAAGFFRRKLLRS
jgi:PEP-CTERM motif